MAVIDTSSRLTANMRQAAQFLVDEFDIQPPSDIEDEPFSLKAKKRRSRAPKLPQAHLLSPSELVELLLNLPEASTWKKLAKFAQNRVVSGLPAALVMEWAYVRAQLTQAEANTDGLANLPKSDHDIPTTSTSHSSSSINESAPTTSRARTFNSRQVSSDIPLLHQSTPDLPPAGVVDANILINDNIDQRDSLPTLASTNHHTTKPHDLAIGPQDCARLPAKQLLARHVVALINDTALGSESKRGGLGNQLVVEFTVDSTDTSIERDHSHGAGVGELTSGRETVESVDLAAAGSSEEDSVCDFSSKALGGCSVVKDVGGGQKRVGHCLGKRPSDEEETDVSDKRARPTPSSSPTRGVF